MTAVKGLHIEPTNICTLKCSGCARTRFLQSWPDKWRNHSLDPEELDRFLDLDLKNIPIVLGGVYGDPIYHPNLILLLSKLKSRGAALTLVTNGSYRTRQWWQTVCAVLNNEDRITFSIDGMPENFLNYRQNANWQSIKTGIEVCVNSPVLTEWSFIPFAFNEEHVDCARDLANSLGIDQFTINPSDRFDELTEHLRPSQQFIGRRENLRKDLPSEIDPRCANGNEHYISSDGFYTSCCYLADHRFYYKTQFWKQQNKYDIRSQTLSQILTMPETIQFYRDLQSIPSSACRFNCPKS